MTVSFDDYQTRAASTALYPECGTGSRAALAYVALGLGETGEVQGKVADLLARGGNADDLAEVAAELGDVLWYIARVAAELDRPLSVVASWHQSEGTQGADSMTAYVERAREARPGIGSVESAALALGSSGVLQGLVKKMLRGDAAAQQASYVDTLLAALAHLLEDVAVLADVAGVELTSIAEGNLVKLSGRAARGTLKGSGDHR